MPKAASLTINQTHLLAELLAGQTVVAAAQKLTIPLRTARTWVALDAFQAEYVMHRKELLDRAHTVLFKDMHRAAQRLTELIDSEHEGIALRAALALLDVASERILGDDLDARLKALEGGSDGESESD